MFWASLLLSEDLWNTTAVNQLYQHPSHTLTSIPKMPAKHHKVLSLTSGRGIFEVGDKVTPKPGPGDLLVQSEATA